MRSVALCVVLAAGHCAALVGAFRLNCPSTASSRIRFVRCGAVCKSPAFATRLRGGNTASRTKMAGAAEAAAFESAMEVAIRAVEQAAEAARFVARSYSTTFEEGTIGKVDASPVTVADFAVQAVVCKRLLDAFPDDPVIAEEAADELRANPELCERVLDAVRVVEVCCNCLSF